MKGTDLNSSVRPNSVRFDEDSFWIELSDGRTLGVPLAWFPRLLRAPPEQREAVSLSSRGAGRGDQTRRRTKIDVA